MLKANLTLKASHNALQDLESHLFGNPHSQHGWSGNEGSAQAVAEARQQTLQMCNAPLGEYECIFTSGATGITLQWPYAAAYKLPEACYPQLNTQIQAYYSLQQQSISNHAD